MSSIRKSKLVLATLAIACGFATSSDAQNIQFASQQGPYYVGEPVLVQVAATGFNQADDVVCKLIGDIPDGVTIEGPQIGRSSSSYMQIINGRVSQRDSIDYRFSFVVTANREDSFEIGPFEIVTNGKSERLQVRSTRPNTRFPISKYVRRCSINFRSWTSQEQLARL